MANVENSMIINGKKSEHFQTCRSITTTKCGIPLYVHIMVIVKLVRVKGGDNSGISTVTWELNYHNSETVFLMVFVVWKSFGLSYILIHFWL
jgi:hypothetical protein